jgi:hypothetical protein
VNQLQTIENELMVPAYRQAAQVRDALEEILTKNGYDELFRVLPPEYVFGIDDPTGHIPYENFTVSAIGYSLGYTIQRPYVRSGLVAATFHFKESNLEAIVPLIELV